MLAGAEIEAECRVYSRARQQRVQVGRLIVSLPYRRSSMCTLVSIASVFPCHTGSRCGFLEDAEHLEAAVLGEGSEFGDLPFTGLVDGRDPGVDSGALSQLNPSARRPVTGRRAFTAQALHLGRGRSGVHRSSPSATQPSRLCLPSSRSRFAPRSTPGARASSRTSNGVDTTGQ